MGPNFSVSKLKGKNNRISDIRSIPQHEKDAVILPVLQTICKFGDEDAVLVALEKVLTRDVKSFYTHQNQTMIEKGVWSWEHVSQFIDPDSQQYDPEKDVFTMLQGVNFEVAKVLRYVSSEFSLPKRNNLCNITQEQREMLQDCIILHPETGDEMDRIH